MAKKTPEEKAAAAAAKKAKAAATETPAPAERASATVEAPESDDSGPVKGMPKAFKAFTMLKVPGGWAFLELTVNSDMLIEKVETDGPNVRAIIQEKFKIQVGKYWAKLEG